MLNSEDRKVIEGQLGFWNKLENKQKELLLANTLSKTYQKGECIYGAGTECLGVLLVKKGELRVFILSEEGREVTLYRLGPGDTCVLSASCILKSITFDVHIEAQEKTEVLIINIAAFSMLAKDNIYVENFSLQNTVERFSEVMWAIEQILFSSLDKRLAGFLIEESDRIGGMKLKLTHEHIAKNIGSAREVVSRMLKVFSDQGLIEQSRGQIKIIDEKGLEDYL